MTADSNMSSDAADRRVLLGRIVGSHGVRGEVRIESWTDPPEAILSYRPWLLSDARGERELTEFKGSPAARGVIARLPGIDDRDQAQSLKGTEISVKRSQLPAPAPGEYYWVDLEGLAVRTVEGVDLGQVEKVLPTGSNDVLVVRGERERLLPFVLGQFVKSVDLDARLIVVDWDPDF